MIFQGHMCLENPKSVSKTVFSLSGATISQTPALLCSASVAVPALRWVIRRAPSLASEPRPDPYICSNPAAAVIPNEQSRSLILLLKTVPRLPFLLDESQAGTPWPGLTLTIFTPLALGRAHWR